MKYICLSICGILNTFPASLIRICVWAMLQAVMIIVRFVQTSSGLLMCDISITNSGFQIFFSGLPGTCNKRRNHILLRKFLSTLLPPKCTQIKLLRRHQYQWSNPAVCPLKKELTWSSPPSPSEAMPTKAFHPLRQEMTGLHFDPLFPHGHGNQYHLCSKN